MIRVILSEEEQQQADEGGLRRQQRAVQDGRKDRHGFTGDPLKIHRDGVGGEMAVYKAFGLVWKDTPYEKDERDLPHGLEVRTRTQHWHELLVWPCDKMDRGYILVTKEEGDPEYRIHGLMLGEDAMQDKYWKQVSSRPASFFVPQNDLVPIEEVIQSLQKVAAS